ATAGCFWACAVPPCSPPPRHAGPRRRGPLPRRCTPAERFSPRINLDSGHRSVLAFVVGLIISRILDRRLAPLRWVPQSEAEAGTLGRRHLARDLPAMILAVEADTVDHRAIFQAPVP